MPGDNPRRIILQMLADVERGAGYLSLEALHGAIGSSIVEHDPTLDDLEDQGCIQYSKGFYRITRVGKIALSVEKAS